MGLKLHATLQVSALPDMSFVVHAFPSSQTAGHDSTGSQVSPDSITPLPQIAPGAPPDAPALPPDPLGDSFSLEHDVSVNRQPSSATANEAFLIGDSPIGEPAGSRRAIGATNSCAGSRRVDG
jgi:hypothetical protein